MIERVSGVVDRLREMGYAVTAFNASEATARKDRSGELGFINTRSAAWWHLRELLDPAYGPVLALPPDALLTGDLTAPHWHVTSTGRIQIESKPDIKKRIGRSTDAGDAVVQAVWSFDGTGAQAWIDYMARQVAKQPEPVVETVVELELVSVAPAAHVARRLDARTATLRAFNPRGRF